MLFELLFGTGVRYFFANRRSSAILAATFLRSLANLTTVSILVVELEFGLKGALYGILIANVLAGIGVSLIHFHRLGISFSWPRFVAMARHGIPLVPSQIASIGTLFIERFFLAKLNSLHLAGLYYLSWRFGDLLSMLTFASFNPIFIVSRLEQFRDGEFDADAPKLFTYFFAFISCAALALSLLAPELLSLAATESYASASMRW